MTKSESIKPDLLGSIGVLLVALPLYLGIDLLHGVALVITVGSVAVFWRLSRRDAQQSPRQPPE